MIELKGNDSQKQKASQPCTHVHLCNKSVSARNGCYRISSVWDWKVISHLVFISPKDTVRGVKGNSKEVLEICTRYGYTCQPFFSTASNSTLYGSVPYMETLPRTKGGRGVILSTYIFELGIWLANSR